MPGKNVGEYSWRYMTPMTQLRSVAASGDTYSQAALDSLVPSIEFHDSLTAAYDNALTLALLMPATATAATVEVYVDTKAVDGAGVPITANRWCLAKTQTFVKSSTIMFRDVPAGTLKVLVTGIAGSGTVVLCWSKSK